MTDAQETTMDPELMKAINYAQKLLDAAIDVVGAALECVELNQNWARDPKIVGLTILCRSISNFRASVRLVQQDQALEAKALVRLMYENLLWLAAPPAETTTAAMIGSHLPPPAGWARVALSAALGRLA
jgi:hypothetical protein